MKIPIINQLQLTSQNISTQVYTTLKQKVDMMRNYLSNSIIRQQTILAAISNGVIEQIDPTQPVYIQDDDIIAEFSDLCKMVWPDWSREYHDDIGTLSIGAANVALRIDLQWDQRRQLLAGYYVDQNDEEQEGFYVWFDRSELMWMISEVPCKFSPTIVPLASVLSSIADNITCNSLLETACATVSSGDISIANFNAFIGSIKNNLPSDALTIYDGLTEAFKTGNVAYVCSTILSFFSDLKNVQTVEGGFEFTDNSVYGITSMLSSAIIGAFSTIGQMLGVLIAPISLIASAVTSAIGAILNMAFTKLDQTYHSATITHVNLSSDDRCCPFAFGQITNAVEFDTNDNAVQTSTNLYDAYSWRTTSTGGWRSEMFLKLVCSPTDSQLLNYYGFSAPYYVTGAGANSKLVVTNDKVGWFRAVTNNCAVDDPAGALSALTEDQIDTEIRRRMYVALFNFLALVLPTGYNGVSYNYHNTPIGADVENMLSTYPVIADTQIVQWSRVTNYWTWARLISVMQHVDALSTDTSYADENMPGFRSQLDTQWKNLHTAYYSAAHNDEEFAHSVIVSVPSSKSATFITLPNYDKADIIMSLVIGSLVVVGTVAAAITAKVIGGKMIRRKRAKLGANCEAAWSDLTDHPNDPAKVKAYERAVKKNNLFTSIFGGTQYSKESYWASGSGGDPDSSPLGYARVLQVLGGPDSE